MINRKSNIFTEIKEVKAEKGIVTFYTSVFDVKDSDGDIIEKGAFTKTLSESFDRVKHLKDHTLTIGLPIKAEQDDYGLLVTSQLFRGKQISDEILIEYKTYAEQGRAMEHSFGYQIVKENFDKSRNANILKELKLWEVTTMTTWGSNENARQVGLKGIKDLMFEMEILKNMINSELPDIKKMQFEMQYNKLEKMLKPSTQPEPDTFDTSILLTL